jgi:hypothetical protein
MPTLPAQAQIILTITPDGTLFVSLRHANGTQSPLRAIPVDQDRRLGVFVADMQALARQKLAAIESAGVRPAARRDGEPAIADTVDGKQVRQRA